MLRAYLELISRTSKCAHTRSRTSLQRLMHKIAHVPKSSPNIADEIQTLMSRLTSAEEDFVRSLFVQLHRSPAVILYTDEQIQDLRTLCSKECLSSLRSILSVDRTFNLSALFVTVMAYRNRKIIRKATQQPPIFIDPLMLHGNGKFDTYAHFFTAVNAALQGSVVDSSEIVCDGIVTGSDEEQALVNAAKIVFPNSKQLFCMLHCKDNVRHHLTSIGVVVSVREQILSKLFGCNGVAKAEDETMDDRIAELLQYVRQNNVEKRRVSVSRVSTLSNVNVEINVRFRITASYFYLYQGAVGLVALVHRQEVSFIVLMVQLASIG